MAIARPRGTKDLLPDEETAWWWLHDTHRRVAASYGYRFIDTPIFEATELFSRGVGSGTDVVDKEMYTFDDRAGRSLTLRPEGTAGVLRAVMDAHLLEDTRPVRVHYAGPMFRYDRPQEGRYRQFSSVGVECIGERSPFLDVEVIEMGWGFFAALGLTGISLQVNTLGDSDDRRRYREMLVSYFSPIANTLCEDCQRRLSINPLRLLDCKRDAQAVAGAPSALDAVSSASRDYFDTVLRGLQYEAIPVHINPRLVRGLDYYAHTAFEFWHASLQGAQNALGGGGRYDGLSELIGREPVAGTGYGLGVDRILQAAHRQGVAPQPRPQCDAVVAPVTAAEVPVAAELARRLRQAGVRTSLDPVERKLDRKVRDAGRSGAHALVIVGPEEVESRTLKVRDLSARTQTSAPQEDVVSAVEAILARSVSSGDRAAAR